ncbi:hypothetical protein AB4538_08760 [Vibrio lentus]
MTVTYQVINLSDGGGSENLLINPRGKINQANESDGVLSAGQYFCDGWKAGAAGAEVYRDSDGFRLISGSILQLVPNELDAGRSIRGNLDIISGTPAIRINGGSNNESSDTQTHIAFEVFGSNSKFTRLILAESESLPIYQQSIDELTPCLRFLQMVEHTEYMAGSSVYNHWKRISFRVGMIKTPALTRTSHGSVSILTDGSRVRTPSKTGFFLNKSVDLGDPNVNVVGGRYIADART